MGRSLLYTFISILLVLTIVGYKLYTATPPGDVSAKWTPPLGIISFTLDKNGISISAGKEFVTPIGIFGVEVSTG